MKAYILKLITFIILAIAMSYAMTFRKNIDALFITFYVIIWLGVIVEIISIIKEYKNIKGTSNKKENQ